MNNVGVEFRENAYLETINVELFVTQHPDLPNKQSLFHIFKELLLTVCKDLEYINKNHQSSSDTILIRSINYTIWQASIDKHKGEYKWTF